VILEHSRHEEQGEGWGAGLVCRHPVDPLARISEYQALAIPLDFSCSLLLSDLGQTLMSVEHVLGHQEASGEQLVVGGSGVPCTTRRVLQCVMVAIQRR
jgi:hypothetical protein